MEKGGDEKPFSAKLSTFDQKSNYTMCSKEMLREI
jgi:hypothetical protein